MYKQEFNSYMNFLSTKLLFNRRKFNGEKTQEGEIVKLL